MPDEAILNFGQLSQRASKRDYKYVEINSLEETSDLEGGGGEEMRW